MKNSLNLPLDSFTEKVNTALASLESEMKLGKSSAAKNNTRTAKINDSLVYTFWCIPKRRIIEKLTFIGTGKGSIESGVDVMKCLAATIMALSDAPAAETIKAVIAMIDKTKPDGIVLNGVKYTLAMPDGLGTWLNAEADTGKGGVAGEQTE